MKFKLLAATAAVALATPAYAQSTGGFHVGVTAGTLGIGPEIGYRASPNFGVRGSATFFGLNRDVESDDINYSGDLNLKSYGGTFDLYPFGGGFRISAGARINKNRVDLEAKPTGDVEVGDETYTAAEVGTLKGRVKAKSFSPMLTIGYGGGLSPGLKFGIDAGALFQGAPRVSSLTSTGTLANDPDFKAELANERAEIENDIDRFKVYPVLQLSLAYMFGGGTVAETYVAPVVVPAPVAAPATQTCADGSVILATDMCPAPMAPPVAPSAGERG